ncbi:MAG TPA: hypothetical protein VGC82_00005, partial [Rhodopila sp.]
GGWPDQKSGRARPHGLGDAKQIEDREHLLRREIAGLFDQFQHRRPALTLQGLRIRQFSVKHAIRRYRFA